MRRRSRKLLKDEDPIEGTNVCRLCREEPNEELFGKFFVEKESGFSVHQYCMFFSSGLAQHGKDNEGFDGFLIKDIKKEISRAKRLRCKYCRKPGATIGCCDEKCHQTFHYKCGRQRGSLFQFFDSFNSFCLYHRPTQKVRLVDSNRQICPVCLSEIEWSSRTSLAEVPLVVPCCKEAWFHNSCLQRHAHSSGLHYFRCPLCNNKDIFQEEMLRMGIFIPERDASWEQGDAYADLLFRYCHCDAQKCICPHGRDHKENSGKWRIRLCDLCGQFGTHLKCQHWKRSPEEWHCDVCTNTTPLSSTRQRPVGDHSMDPYISNGDESSSDDECNEVNVCALSDDDLPLAALKRDLDGRNQAQSTCSVKACVSDEGVSPTDEPQPDALQLKSITEEKSPMQKLWEPLQSIIQDQVEEGESPVRKRRRLSLQLSPQGRESSLKENNVVKSENNTNSISDLLSASMTPSFLFAVGDALETVLSGPSTSGALDSVATPDNVKESEAILISNTDSECSSEASVELVKFDSEVNQGKECTECVGEGSLKPTKAFDAAILKSPHRVRKQNLKKLERLSIDGIIKVEADSSATIVSVKVEEETPESEVNSLDLTLDQEPYNSDDDSCLITKVVRKPCPYGNDKFGECFLRCCKPTRFLGATVMSSKGVEGKDLQIMTVMSTSSCDHVVQGTSSETVGLGEQTAMGSQGSVSQELCNIATNTPPLKLPSRKKHPPRQSSITETFYPKGKSPVSPSDQAKRLNLRSKKSGRHLERNLVVNHRCFR